MSNTNWQQYLTEHFNHSCYKGKTFTEKEMLDNYLAMIDHSLQHDDGKVKFTNIEGVRYLQTNSGDNVILLISLEDLKNFGYVPETIQNAKEFIADNWNWY